MTMAGRKTSAAYQMYGFIPKVTNGKHVALCTYCNRELQNTAAVRMQKHRNSCFATRVENTETSCVTTGTIASIQTNSDSKQSLSTDIGFSVYQRLHNSTLNAPGSIGGGNEGGGVGGALKREQSGDFESTPPPAPVVSLGETSSLFDENLKTPQQGSIPENLGSVYNQRIQSSNNNNNDTNISNNNLHSGNMKQVNDIDYETTVTASSPRNYPDDEIKLEPSCTLNGSDPTTFAASKITANAFQEISRVAAAATAATSSTVAQQNHPTEYLGMQSPEGLSTLSSAAACRALESFGHHNQHHHSHQQQAQSQYAQFSIEEFDDMASDIRIGPNSMEADDRPHQLQQHHAGKTKNVGNNNNNRQQQTDNVEGIIRAAGVNFRGNSGLGAHGRRIYGGLYSGDTEADDENDEDDDDDELDHLENHLDVIQELMPRSRKMQRLQTTMTAVATEYYRNKTAYYAHLNENSQLKRVLMLLQSKKLQLEIEKHNAGHHNS